MNILCNISVRYLGHVGFNFGIVCYSKLASSQLLSAH